MGPLPATERRPRPPAARVPVIHSPETGAHVPSYANRERPSAVSCCLREARSDLACLKNQVNGRQRPMTGGSRGMRRAPGRMSVDNLCPCGDENEGSKRHAIPGKRHETVCRDVAQQPADAQQRRDECGAGRPHNTAIRLRNSQVTAAIAPDWMTISNAACSSAAMGARRSCARSFRRLMGDGTGHETCGVQDEDKF